MITRHYIAALVASLVAAVGACNPNDEKAFTQNGNIEAKPISPLLNGNAVGDAGNAADANAATIAASVTYEIKVTTASGSVPCIGSATLQILSDFNLKLPAAKMQCVSLTIDLAAMLSGLGGATAIPNNVKSDGRVLSVAQIANATFTPARPFILGPIVQDASKYANFHRVSQHHVASYDANGAPTESDGAFEITVLSPQTTYGNKYVGQKAFDHILHWTITTSGFDKIPPKNGVLVRKMEWLWNTVPIMIPRISIYGRLGDFIGGPGAADAMVGDVTVDLLVTKYQVN